MSTELNFLPRVMGENLKNADSEWPKQPAVSYLLGGKALGANVGVCVKALVQGGLWGATKDRVGEGLWPC